MLFLLFFCRVEKCVRYSKFDVEYLTSNIEPTTRPSFCDF